MKKALVSVLMFLILFNFICVNYSYCKDPIVPTEGITQEEFEYYLTHEYPVFILIVGTIESEIVNREVNLALEKCLPILVFIKTKNTLFPTNTACS